MTTRDEIIAEIAEEQGADAAQILALRLFDIRTLNQVAVQMQHLTAPQVRQIEVRAIRTLSTARFIALTDAVREVRPEFGWHDSVHRARGEDWIAIP